MGKTIRRGKLQVRTSIPTGGRPGVIFVASHYRTLPGRHRISKHLRNERRSLGEISKLGTRKDKHLKTFKRKIMREIRKTGVIETGVKREI